MLTYVMGDIHGCRGSLVLLFNKIKKHAGDREHRIVMLGDYIDRGPDSAGCVQFLIENLRPGIDVALMGNHEDMLLANFADYYGQGEMHRQDLKQCFFMNGGLQTMQSYGLTPDSFSVTLPPEHMEFYRNLKLVFEDKRRIYVHAGINPAYPLVEQNRWDMLWIRDSFLLWPETFEKYVVHGHTPVLHGPDIRHNRANMDTGGVFGGKWGAGVFDDSQDAPVDWIELQRWEY